MPKGRTQLANGWWAEDGEWGVHLYAGEEDGDPGVTFHFFVDGEEAEAAVWAAARAFAAIPFAQEAVTRAKLGWPHTWEGRGGAHPPDSTARKIVDSLRDFDGACQPPTDKENAE